ncbi:MAG: putative transglutaminase-like protein [Frankiales bacterium]|nr:putative transglutaminase-like protein [Frankiales bacterium]
MDTTRVVAAHLRVTVADQARLAFQVGISNPAEFGATESIELAFDGSARQPVEIATAHGGRIWLLDCLAGTVTLDYRARLSTAAPAAPVLISDELVYLRPSRYCESDRLVGFAQRHFHDIRDPQDVLAAVSSWVGTQLEYVSGSSGPTDGAIDTLLAGRGVCRDYAHLAVGLLRAMQIPARLVAVYAPGLSPMDFHAVAEAYIEGAWFVVDGTLLAPRSSLVRIATGRDAADTSFLSTYGGEVQLDSIDVAASVEGDLPEDDVQALVQLQ